MAEVFIKKDNKLIVNVNYLEAYIPASYYEKGIVSEYGKIIMLFGLFTFRTASADNGNIATGRLNTFNFPMIMHTTPSLIEKKEFSIAPKHKNELYYVYKYYKGDIIVNSTKVVQGLNNTKVFLNLLDSGKIPVGIDYFKLIKVYLKHLELNKMDLGVSMKTLEFKLAELCRDIDKPEIPFCKSINNGNVAVTDYIMMSLRNLAMLTSTFSALTFEDINTMMANSINSKRQGTDESISPVERIIKY